MLVLVYILGFPVDIMDVDSAQYASISKEMTQNGSYLQVMLYGRDYLDKPPLLFWVTAFFFNLFGYANWSFKLGSFLFTLIGVYSTFRLGKLLYSTKVGYASAMILFSCQAFILFNNDVRTDTILTSAVVLAIWQIMEWLSDRKWKWLIGASIGIACAMMAKGPIGIMVPVLAVGSWIVGTKRWSDVFRWQYLVLLVLVTLMLAPMLYGLYMQFDMHPEKEVGMVSPNGIVRETNVSGLKFYLWTQSFGRLTGENVWSNGAGPFFFVHNFLWSFLPWALLFIVAFFSRIVQVFQAILSKRTLPELLTLGGFILPFVALSMSKYKLPHYIFVVYPLAAILLASWCEEVWEKHIKGLKITSFILQLLVWLISSSVVAMIYFWFFPDGGLGLAIFSIAFMLISLFYLVKYSANVKNLLVGSVLISVGVNIAMNGWFYPNIMHYQLGSNAAFAVKELNLPTEKLYSYNFHAYSFYYYSQEPVNKIQLSEIGEKLDSGDEVYIVTREKNIQKIKEHYQFEILREFGSYPVTLLSLKFLNPQTRSETLKPVYIIQVTGINENSKFVSF